MEIKFGTDGWRGIIARDFTFQNVRLVIQSICDYLKKSQISNLKSQILVGYDCRFLSREFAATCAHILQGNGFGVLLSDKAVPTPVVSYNVVKRRAAGAVVITASHNSYEFNGLKFKTPQGCSAGPKITKKFEERIPQAQIRVSQEVIQEMSFERTYNAHVAGLVDMMLLKKKKMKVCVDPLFGTARGFMEMLLKDSAMQIISDHDWRDPLFAGVNPEPIAQNIGGLRQSVRKKKADIGIAFDGDADRVGMVDKSGAFVNSHQIFSLLLLHLIKNKKQHGNVVKTISGTYLIGRICRKYGLSVHETPIGFKYIGDLMLREDILIGGEESGGIGFRGHIPERDGILSGLYMLELMAYSGKDLAQLRQDLFTEFGVSCYDRIDFKLNPACQQPDKSSFTAHLKEQMAKSVLQEDIAAFKDYDGLKTVLRDGSWLLLRPSGTEPVVRIYAESNTKLKVKKLIDLGCKLVYKMQKRSSE